MRAMTNITRFQIKNLHGYKDFNLEIKDNTIILVGENGSGKTTVLRLLYYFLSGQWRLLSTFQFEQLIITIDDKQHILPYSLIKRKIKSREILRRLPSPIRNEIIHLYGNDIDSFDMEKIYTVSNKFDLPLSYLLRDFDESTPSLKELDKISEEIRSSLKAQILYLPTYRRIEQELGFIFKGVDIDEFRKRSARYENPEKINETYVELIEFGMKDVEFNIRKTLERLKEFTRENLNNLTLGYLGDVVDRKYAEVNVNQIKDISDETIDNVLNRIENTILSAENKQHVKETIQKVKHGGNQREHSKVVSHYFIKLMNFQKDIQEKELQIKKFCDVCNEYMVDKKLIYDSINFKFSIKSKSDKKDDVEREIELKHLSSGEKQIVSLFSHVYLSGTKKYFVLIDEPELSLSVPWQKKFLVDIKNGQFCAGLVAVTHSPFIYNNELEKYAHAIGEFVY
jgi:predicted ATPase